MSIMPMSWSRGDADTAEGWQVFFETNRHVLFLASDEAVRPETFSASFETR